MWIIFSLFQSLLIILLAFAFPRMINHKYELKLFVKLVLAGVGAFVAFLLIPICTIVQTFKYMVDIRSSQCEGVLWFYFFLSFLTISYFFNPGLSTFFQMYYTELPRKKKAEALKGNCATWEQLVRKKGRMLEIMIQDREVQLAL